MKSFLGGVAVVLVLVVVASAIPDIRRYIRISSM
jgi:hypothetical protein